MHFSFLRMVRKRKPDMQINTLSTNLAVSQTALSAFHSQSLETSESSGIDKVSETSESSGIDKVSSNKQFPLSFEKGSILSPTQNYLTSILLFSFKLFKPFFKKTFSTKHKLLFLSKNLQISLLCFSTKNSTNELCYSKFIFVMLQDIKIC